MKTKTLWLLVLAAAGLALTAGAAGALPVILDAEADVAGTINYQGRLTDPGGRPLDGTFPMRFQIYDDPVAGTFLWDSGMVSVDVDNGLFNIGLSVDANDFDGRGLWLRIYVDGEWLTPRQALLPVPYALSLKPGAEIQGQPTETGHVLRVEMTGTNATRAAVWGYTSTGDAVRGTSAGGWGLAGYTNDGYAVRGVDQGSSTARGYGGYFSSTNGIGVYGYSSASTHFTNMYAPGVYGRSLNGSGVYGLSESDHSGVIGQSSSGNGVSGYSSNAIGVYGATGGSTSSDYGVYGTGGNGTYGVVGYKTGSSSGLGVYGANEGSGSGVSGYGAAFVGVWGHTGAASNNYGLYTPDNLYSANYHTTGAAMQIVQSADTEPLEAGDVVEIAGMGASPVEGLPPVIQVRKVREAGSSAVLGVVASGYAQEWLVDASLDDPGAASGANREIPPSEGGPVAPGGYMLVVVRGPVLVKVNGSSAIRPGDLLSSAAQAGHAQKASGVSVEGSPTAQSGSFLGKALEAWDGGQGRIYVFVTLQ